MIVVGYDGSEWSIEAVRWAAREATRRQEPLRVLSAVPMPVVPGAEYLPATTVDDFIGEAGKIAERGVSIARTAGAADVKADGVTANPARALLEASESASLVVVGNRGHHEFVEALIGSVSFAVAAHASCPTVVVRGQARETLDQVVAAVDGSEQSLRAVEFAAAAAASAGASLQLVAVWNDPALAAGFPVWEYADEVRKAVEQDLQRARESAVQQHPGLTVTTEVARGEAAVEIARLAEGADLLVAGSRGRGGFKSLLLGSVSRRLVSTAPCPVAVVR